MRYSRTYLITGCIAAFAGLSQVSAAEVSPGGSRIFEYEDVTPETAPPDQEAVHAEDIQNALTPFLGENFVFHELVSQAAHIDLLVFPPTSKRSQWTFVTSGMSDKAMTLPPDLDLNPDQYGFAELVMAVPASWFTKGPDGKIATSELQDPMKYWPIETLKFLARFPHEYRTWFWESHTIPNGNPAEPYAANTRQNGVLLAQLSDWPDKYRKVSAADGTLIKLFAVVPIYPEEMQAKLDLGAEVLLPALIRAGVTELVMPMRKNVGTELSQ